MSASILKQHPSLQASGLRSPCSPQKLLSLLLPMSTVPAAPPTSVPQPARCCIVEPGIGGVCLRGRRAGLDLARMLQGRSSVGILGGVAGGWQGRSPVAASSPFQQEVRKLGPSTPINHPDLGLLGGLPPAGRRPPKKLCNVTTHDDSHPPARRCLGPDPGSPTMPRISFRRPDVGLGRRRHGLEPAILGNRGWCGVGVGDEGDRMGCRRRPRETSRRVRTRRLWERTRRAWKRRFEGAKTPTPTPTPTRDLRGRRAVVGSPPASVFIGREIVVLRAGLQSDGPRECDRRPHTRQSRPQLSRRPHDAWDLRHALHNVVDCCRECRGASPSAGG